jgi:hypothetical protein
MISAAGGVCEQIWPLRVLSYASMAFAMALAVIALTMRLAPAAPAYITFLFLGLIASFAASAIADLERRIAELSRNR